MFYSTMMLLSMKTYPALLWGTCVMFALESTTASTPETSSVTFTVEPNMTTMQLTTAHVHHAEKETQPATWGPTHKSAEVSVAAAAETTVLPTVETEKQEEVSNKAKSSSSSTAGLAATSTAAAATNSPGLRVLRTSAAVSTAAGEARHTTVTGTATHTEHQFHQQSATAFTDVAAPATTSAAFSAPESVSSPQPTSITQPELTSALSSTTSSDTEIPVFNQNLSSPSASSTPRVTTNPTSKAAPMFDSTFLPVKTTEASTSTELSSASQSTSTAISTSQLPDTTGSGSTSPSISTDSPSSAAAASTSPVGTLIPREPKKLPSPPTKSAPATTAASPEVSKNATVTEAQPCSTRGMVKQCLIVIACLAGLATIFMVSTIVLCTKLSARKYKVKQPQQATEMMCISALLPERNYTYTRQRNPVTNGVLVMPWGSDSDEDGGDNLTLSSFLPENDRFV